VSSFLSCSLPLFAHLFSFLLPRILGSARINYLKALTIIAGFKKSGCWPIDPSAIPFVKQYLEAEERRRLDPPSTPPPSSNPSSSAHHLNTSARQLPLTPSRRRTALMEITKAFMEQENLQPDDDLTTSNALVYALCDQLQRDEVRIAQSSVRKREFDQEKEMAEGRPGDMIGMKDPEHEGLVLCQESSFLHGKLLLAEMLKKRPRGGVLGGRVGKRIRKDSVGLSLGGKAHLRAAGTGGRAKGGERGAGGVDEESLSFSDWSMDTEEEEREDPRDEEITEVVPRVADKRKEVVKALPRVGRKKKGGREKKDLSRYWTYETVPWVEEERVMDEGAGGSTEVMGHRLRAI